MQAAAEGECQSDQPDDTSYADCQTFCSAASKDSHCKLCKCRACGFCDNTCSSSFEDDGGVEACESWCSADFFGDHCQRCKCKGCGFCKAGPPCSSNVPEDSSYKMCEPFCDSQFASSHCSMCKCQQCDFCTAASVPGVGTPAVASTCTSGIEGDVDHETCEAFCDPASKDTHCNLCKCRGCNFCSCSSEHEADSSVEECQKWCRDDQIGPHCSWCACKGCRFCEVGGKACESFYLTGDTDYEACDGFCSAQSADTHCGMCKCKQCGFCAEHEKHGGKIVAAPPPPACFSGQSHDFLFEGCERFCTEGSKEDQLNSCKLCKCKGCRTCSAICESGIPGDTKSVGCSTACDPEQAEGFCGMCKCRGCPFCNEDGSVAQLEPGALDGQSCIPANDKDISEPKCYSHCSESNKATHCETCKCKACDFCDGFKACDSGQKHDTKWVDCDASCNGRESCHLCKCQGCDTCEAAAMENTVPCDSGILGDTEYEACLGGICNSKVSDATCQMCRCKGCGFCAGFGVKEEEESEEQEPACTSAFADDVDFPMCDSFCSPEFAENHCARCKCKSCSFCEEMSPVCDAGHVLDSKTEQCAAWCAPTAESVAESALCSFCSCRKCDLCSEVEFDESPTGNGRQCSVGAELIVTSRRKDAEKNTHYAVLVRLGSWQRDGKVKVSFEGGPKLHYDEGSDTHATLVSQEGAARIFTFNLGPEPGPLNSFGFRFSLLRATLDTSKDWPQIVCWNIPPAPAPRPNPPPPPFRPYIASTAAQAQAAKPHFTHAPDFCALGGLVKIIKAWAGGTSFQVDVVMAIWRPGAVVTLDFASPLIPEERGEVSQIGAQHVSNAELLPRERPGTMRFRLTGEADEHHGFNMIGHGGVVHDHPIITCSDLGQAASAPPPPRTANIDGSCVALGLMYTVIQKWNGGFKSAFAVAHWLAGSVVKVHFPGGGVQLLDSWSATANNRQGATLDFVLGPGPDPEYHGFGFTARGDGNVASTPDVSCIVDAEFASLVEVNKAFCGMGAAYSVSAPATAGGESEVRVRVHQWEIGALITMEFTTRVDASQPLTSATRKSNALGDLHTFELGDFPDAGHGFKFNVAASSVQVTRVACAPRQSNSPPAPAVERGSPDPPTDLVLKQATCDSLDVAWNAAVDNGFAVRGHTVFYRRRDAAEDSFEEVEVGPESKTTLSGLAGSTTYYVKVRARNDRGAGHQSARLAAATLSGGGPKTATTAPEALDSPDCHSITLSLPKLRPGCRGDAFLSVHRREAGDDAAGWSKSIERSAQGTVTVRDLEPYSAYEFRVVAHNDDGESPASVSSGLLLTDVFSRVGVAPSVVATSSASFALSWTDLAGACRPSLRYQILYTRDPKTADPKTAGEVEWLQLATDVQGGSYEAFPLRCEPPGCAFRVIPLGQPGLEQLAPRSLLHPSLRLKNPPAGAVRLELRLLNAQLDRDQLLMRQQVEDDIEHALKVGRGTIDVQDVFGSNRYVVIDVHDTASQNGGKSPVAAALLAEQLQLLVQDIGGTSPLRDGSVTRGLDPQAGVQLLLTDGRVTPVRPNSAARDAVYYLPRAKQADNPLGAAGPITVVLTTVTVLGACVLSAMRSRAAMMQYGRVAPDER